ncbi:hypothetical protein HQ403_01180 [Candidatus Kaiserbacteria bacterium]|nr:hypothetical protein [Candidatus Kaiserbacteria bacterium]
MNKRNILIITIIVLILGFGYYNFSNENTLTPPNNSELGFNIDLENLSYQLPTHSLVCIPELKQLCSTGNECESTKVGVFLLIDEVNSKYSRCDNQPCDTYDSTFVESGIYTVINPLAPNHGEIKIAQDGTYTETNSLGDNVYISRGVCRKTSN